MIVPGITVISAQILIQNGLYLVSVLYKINKYLKHIKTNSEGIHTENRGQNTIISK